jgi:hypothetical protein
MTSQKNLHFSRNSLTTKILCFVAFCGLLWRFVAFCGVLWRFVAFCGFLWLFVAFCGV